MKWRRDNVALHVRLRSKLLPGGRVRAHAAVDQPLQRRRNDDRSARRQSGAQQGAWVGENWAEGERGMIERTIEMRNGIKQSRKNEGWTK